VRKSKLTVRLDDAPLFDPGKAVLKPDGQKTLGELAQALKEIADRELLVAGHTDNRPLRSSTYSSNWELSAARAVQVVRFLQSEGLDPRRLAAAGYSEFDRVDDGETVESRAKNRRIEVVILPRADELPVIDLDGVEPGSPARRSPSAQAAPRR
jgi:chemotaxis protein MotB